MSKKIKVIAIALVIVALLLLTIYFGTRSANLDKVSLTLDDLGQDYIESYKNHIITPYIASNITLFSGWKILESYEVHFFKIDEVGNVNNSCFIRIQIGKLENKYEEAVSKIKNTNYSYDYTEIESDIIGQESYIGQSNTTITVNSVPINVMLYFIVFRIDNIVVAMVTSGHSLETSINYAKIMENKILSN